MPADRAGAVAIGCADARLCGVIRRRFFTPRLKFKSYAEMNAWLEDRCIAWAKAHPHPEVRDKTVHEMFEAEWAHATDDPTGGLVE